MHNVVFTTPFHGSQVAPLKKMVYCRFEMLTL